MTDNGTAALALSISTLNTLIELKLVTLEQGKQTVDHAVRAVGEADREAVRAVLARTIPALVR